MTVETSLALAFVCFIFMASPGPGTFALLGHALAHGFTRSFGFILGMAAGDLVFLTLAILGMAVIARTFEGLFLVIRLAAAAYLIWLGIKAWRTAPKMLEDGNRQITRSARAHNMRGFVSGLLVTLSNPKTIMFYVGFLPAFMDLSLLTAADAGIVVTIVIGVLLGSMSLYAAAAERARRMLKSRRAQKMLNRGSGSIMIGAGVVIAARG
ncbi:MAG: LysE family translocator [Rhodospirillaceae bacterium]|nr:LysE family translocator [Rhodospirillaceae bacterium]